MTPIGHILGYLGLDPFCPRFVVVGVAHLVNES